MTDTDCWVVAVATPAAHILAEAGLAVAVVGAILVLVSTLAVDPFPATSVLVERYVLDERKAQLRLLAPRAFVFVTYAPCTVRTPTT